MKKHFIGYLFLTTLALTQACLNNNGTQSTLKNPTTVYHRINFAAFIGKHKNDRLDYYEELLVNKEFLNVLEHSKLYVNDVNTFLKNGDFTAGQVAVCICAMQNLSVNDYVKLCNLVLSLYNDNKVPVGILEHAISPDFLHKRIIINNYSDANVIALLKSIENDKKVTSKHFRVLLPDILSGKSSRELKQFDDDSRSG